MDDAIRDALASDRTVDLTTTGRRSGAPRRLEIWMHQVDGATYITGTPGRRDWYANVLADPRVVLHLKESASADLPATAEPLTDPDERARVLDVILARVGRGAQRDRWLSDSPLIALRFDDA